MGHEMVVFTNFFIFDPTSPNPRKIHNFPYKDQPSSDAFDSTISMHPLMERIERVQYHAALAITGCWRGSNADKPYEEFGL